MTRLNNPWLRIAQFIWLLLIMLSIGLFILGVPKLFDELSTLRGDLFTGIRTDTEVVREGLNQLGISTAAFAFIIIAIVVGFAVFSIVTAFLIVFRKFDDWLVLLVSLSYVTYGTGFVYIILFPSFSFWPSPIDILARFLYFFCGVILYLLFLFLFPDGRFIPRWTAGFALFVVGWGMYITLYYDVSPFTNSRTGLSPPGIVVIFSIFIIVIASQIYRYIYVSTPSQRQQTKWVVFGFSTAILLSVAIGLPGLIDPYLVPRRFPSALYLITVISFSAIFAMIGLISLTFAILRYRLWDIDRLIRRTIIYSLLSSMLLVTYFGIVVVLERLVRTLTTRYENSSVVIVISTLAIAALFKPLLVKVQVFVDNSFYQGKYQAEKISADFAIIARDEVDLNHLTVSLTGVIQETMHPAHISLWLRERETLYGQGEQRSRPKKTIMRKIIRI